MAERINWVPDDAEEVLQNLKTMREDLWDAFNNSYRYNSNGGVASAQIAEAYTAVLRQDLELRRQMIAATRQGAVTKKSVNLKP